MVAAYESDDPCRPNLLSVPASEVEVKRPEWILHQWIVRGDLHLLAACQGGGKTTFAAYVAAVLTAGKPWLGNRSDPGQPLEVAWLSLEEQQGRIVARLRANGVDDSRIRILGEVVEGLEDPRPWNLPGDFAALENYLTEYPADLLIVDGLGYAVTGDGSYPVVARTLSKLGKVAERHRLAILGITHTPKAASNAKTAAIGSTAWTALARILWVIGDDPDQDGRQVVRVAKSNFEYPPQGIGFSITNDPQTEAGLVSDLTVSEVTAEALVGEREGEEARSERQECAEAIRELLSAGPYGTGPFMDALRSQGFSEATVKRARRQLGVVSVPNSDPKTGKRLGYVLSLPVVHPSRGKEREPMEPLEPVDVTRENGHDSTPVVPLAHQLDLATES